MPPEAGGCSLSAQKTTRPRRVHSTILTSLSLIHSTAKGPAPGCCPHAGCTQRRGPTSLKRKNPFQHLVLFAGMNASGICFLRRKTTAVWTLSLQSAGILGRCSWEGAQPGGSQLCPARGTKPPAPEGLWPGPVCCSLVFRSFYVSRSGCPHLAPASHSPCHTISLQGSSSPAMCFCLQSWCLCLCVDKRTRRNLWITESSL